MTAAERSFQFTALAQLQQRFEEALAQPAEARQSWLRATCSDDPGMLATLLDMVACAEAEHTGVALRIGALAGELAAPADRSGTLIGRYRLQSRIRWGGMAEVYRAIRDDGQFQQEVALKIARSDRKTITQDGWFEAERRLLAQLRHPHICQIFDGGSSASGEPYFVMERIDGEPFLTACLRPDRSWKQVIGYALDLCSAVAHAHRQLIVHRDIKPENVLLADGERVKLLDFGIAATLRPDAEQREGDWARWYSPGYAAPEISAGQTGGIAADVYSLGRLFEALIERASAAQREDLRRICAHATATEPEQRYESVDALAADLRHLRDGLPISLRLHERGYVLRRTLRRWALPLAIGALLILLAVLGVGREIHLRQLAQANALQAQVERDRARAVSDFLSSAYEAANPELNGGEDISVQHLLAMQADSLLADETMPVAVRVELLLTLGRAFFSLGRYQEADRVLARARLELDQTTRSDPLLQAQIAVIQAQVARHTGRHEEAGQILQALLAQESGWPQEQDYVLLRSNLLTTLAALEQSSRRLELAEGHIRRALALRPTLASAEAEQSHRARQLNTLGAIQYAGQDLSAAMSSFEEGLALIANDQRALLERLSLLGWLGIVNSRLGQPERAESMLRAAVEAARALYPNGHVRVSLAHGNLGAMLTANGRLDAAEDSLQQAMATLDALPDEYPEERDSHRLKLARLALLRQDIGSARSHASAHLVGLGNRYGPDHRRLIAGRLVLAEVELLGGQPEAALQLAEQVRATLQSSKQTNDEHWVRGGLLAARALALLDRSDPAQELLAGAFTKLAQQHADNPHVLAPLHQLQADALVELGRFDEALAAYASALSLFDRSVDPAHPARGVCLLQMATLRMALGRAAEGTPAPGDDLETSAMLGEAASILRAGLVPEAPTLTRLERLLRTSAP